jgi:hypothetical protein
MEFIKDKSGVVVLTLDDENLYYRTIEVFEDSKFDEFLSFDYLKLAGNGGLKLMTILDLQEELEIITDVDFVINEIKENCPVLAEMIHEYEDSISVLDNRIVLLEIEGSGHTSAWVDYIYLVQENDSFILFTSRKALLSASEIIEYYGLGENEYWDQIQVNGEFIKQFFSPITSAHELYDGITAILTDNEQWAVKIDDLDWKSIIEVLLCNKATYQMGIELGIQFNLR